MTDVFTQGWKGIRMVRDGDLVAIFNSIHRVMKAEKILKEKGVSFLLIPAPRALKSDCGLALRYIQGDRKMIEEILHESGLAPEEIYRKSGEEFIKVEDSGD